MKDKINEKLLKGADELLNRHDREIMALSLGKNEKHAENYQMAITNKLRESLERLIRVIERFDKTSNRASNILIFLNIILIILTLLISLLTYFLVVKG